MHRELERKLHHTIGMREEVTLKEVKLIPHFSCRCRARFRTYRKKSAEIECAYMALDAFAERVEKGGKA
jgi:hypothetical protein